MSWSQWLGVSENPRVEKLLDTLSWCHQAAAQSNQNLSSAALMLNASGGATFEHCVASALVTLGDKHGPIGKARHMLYHETNDHIIERLEDGAILPGWGNVFYKKSIDPAFVPMDHLLREEYREDHHRLDEIAELIFKVKGKTIYPNAVSYSGITAERIGLAVGVECLLFIACRLPAWAKQYGGVAS